MNESYLLAVDGSLRLGMTDHHIIANQTYLGSFHSDPVYYMFSLSTFPAVIENGDTSIYFEVYEVNGPIMDRLNRLNSYNAGTKVDNFYDLKIIETPYGEAQAYFFNKKINENNSIVLCGDWVKYFNKKNNKTNLNK
jgi:gamma-glutamylaminecyclotransferase